MIITHDVKIDLMRPEIMHHIHAVQDDKYSRSLAITLSAGGVCWEVPSDAAALIRYRKPDGTGGEYDTLPDGTAAWSAKGHILTVALAPQVLTVSGPVSLAVTMIQGAKEITTFAVSIQVHPNVSTQISGSENYFNITARLPAPASAKVGQYFQVAAVDAKGHVTEVRAVDAPAGGGADSEEVKALIEEYLAENPPVTEESDPTVPDWAKQPEKPKYTAEETGARPSTWMPSAMQVGADPAGTANTAVSSHNLDAQSHGDIRLTVQQIAKQLSSFLDAGDVTLDQLSELIAAIKSNDSAIDAITTSKVNVADIVDNLVTNVGNRPLSATQGVVLKGLIDSLSTEKLDADKLSEAVNLALEQAKASGEFDGAPGAAGVSPVVTVSKSEKAATISIEDATGTKTVTINDGSDAAVTKESIENALGYVPAGSGTNSPLTGKKIVYDGDSICAAGFGYPKLIADKTACIFDNQAVGGGRLCANSERHSVVNNLSNLPTDGDIYCFQGGINDWWGNTPVGTYAQGDYTGEVDPATIYGAMETICRYALTNFFGKAVCFVITHKVQNAAHGKNTAGHTFWDYREAMINVCEKYSIPYYDAFTKSGLNGWNAAQKAGLFVNSDGTHPTEAAYEAYYVPQLIALFESIVPIGDYVAPAKPVTYTNVLKLAVDSNGNPYNGGKGYKENYYLSYDGKTESASTNYDITGFIPAKIGDIVRLKNVQLCKDVSGNSKCMVTYHKSDFAHMGSSNWLKEPSAFTAAWQSVTNDAGTDVIQFTVPTTLQASLAYIRLCCGTLTDASVITINEEID